MPIPFAAATPSPGKNPTRVALRDWPDDDDDDDCQLLEVYERPPLAMDGRGKIPAAKSAVVAPETKPSQPRKIRKISQCVPRDPVISGLRTTSAPKASRPCCGNIRSFMQNIVILLPRSRVKLLLSLQWMRSISISLMLKVLLFSLVILYLPSLKLFPSKLLYLGVVEKLLLAEQLRDSVSMSDLMEHCLEQAGQHQLELQKERDEVTRLRQQITKMEQKHKDEVEVLCQAFAKKEEQFSGKAQKTDELLKEAESSLNAAHQDLDALRAKSKTWQSKLGRVNSFSENFLEANMFALRAMQKVRSESSESADGDVTIDEHLVTLSKRVTTLKSCGVDLLNFVICVFRTLWLDEDPPQLIDPLAARLLLSEEQMEQWCESVGRAIADKALSIVLSWYEDINLDVLQNMRADDKWTHDSELIKKRQEQAYAMIEYTNVHAWCDGPSFLDSAESTEEVIEEGEVDSEDIESDVPAAGDIPDSAEPDDAPSSKPTESSPSPALP